MVKNLPATAGDARNVGLILASERPPEAGNDSSLQYSCRFFLDGGAWQATDFEVTKIQT